MTKKSNQLEWHNTLSADAINFTQPEIMAKFISTIDENGYPHISFITSNIAVSSTEIKWGEFTRGMSKGNVVRNPKHGAIYMTVKMPFKFMQLKVDLDRISMEGDDAVAFNTMNLFRYNTYMRVYRVFFCKVFKARKIRNIRLLALVKGIVANIIKKGGKTGHPESKLKELGNRLFSGPIFPKFISYIDLEDGYPVIIPVFQARSVESKRITIPFTQFKEDLEKIPAGAKVSIFAMDFEMVTQMIKGIYKGNENNRGIVDIDIVYNSMPPKIGEIYPNLQVLEKITNFTMW